MSLGLNANLRGQVETYLSQLSDLVRRGNRLRQLLATEPADASAMAATRVWQEECGVTINQLSGGSKAHWLARSFSESFLVRSADGGAVEGAQPAEIVARLLAVLDSAVASLSGASTCAPSSEAPPLRRFDFVHDPELRPVLEQAYAEARCALYQADYELALKTFCGILEAIVTDALEHQSPGSMPDSAAPAGKIADWPFETRLAIAEKAGLIRGSCARLPAIARSYREDAHADGGRVQKAAISERDARVTGQVLNVVMRDLNPGR